MTARKLAEANAQIQTLRRHVAEECVAITSSIDTIPPGMVSREMRDRWLWALRQAMGAVALVRGGSPSTRQPTFRPRKHESQVRAGAPMNAGVPAERANHPDEEGR
jgi:hypothetical protein